MHLDTIHMLSVLLDVQAELPRSTSPCQVLQSISTTADLGPKDSAPSQMSIA
jgi:hypothetical protein